MWSAASGDERIAQKADHALMIAEQRTGLRARGRPQVRLYPTLEMFRDATGASGRVAALTRGRVVHMQPGVKLRAMGVLDAALVHEMLHIVLGQNARRTPPLWLEEGLADVLGGGRTHPAERLRVEALIRQKGRPAVLQLLLAGG